MAKLNPHIRYNAKIPRKRKLEAIGYRAIKGDKQRRYLDPFGDVVSRRQAEQKLTGNFEKFAARNTSWKGVSKTTQATKQARAFAADKGIGVREAQRSPEFKALRKAAKLDFRNEDKSNRELVRDSTKTRLRALYTLDEIDQETFDEYMSMYD